MWPGPWITIDMPARKPACPSQLTMLESGSKRVNSSALMSSVSRTSWVPGRIDMYSP